MSILDQINIAIQDQTGNNHPPQRILITKTYQNNPNLCDITTKNGNKLTKIPVQGTPTINTEALLIYEDGDQNKPIIITGGTEAYTKTETDALLQNKINEPVNEGTNGQVLTTDGAGGRTWKTVQGGGGDGSIITVGSFTINNEGHLIVEFPGATDNPYFINDNGHLVYDTSNIYNGGLIG